MVNSLQEKHGCFAYRTFPIRHLSAQGDYQLAFVLIEISLFNIRLIVHFQQQTFDQFQGFVMGRTSQIRLKHHIQTAVVDKQATFQNDAQMPKPKQLHCFTETTGPTNANIAASLRNSFQAHFFFLALSLGSLFSCQFGITSNQILHTGIYNDHRIQELMLPRFQCWIFFPFPGVFDNTANTMFQEDSQIRGIVSAIKFAEISAKTTDFFLCHKLWIRVQWRVTGEIVVGSRTHNQLFSANIYRHSITKNLKGQSFANRDTSRLIRGVQNRNLATGHFISSA